MSSSASLSRRVTFIAHRGVFVCVVCLAMAVLVLPSHAHKRAQEIDERSDRCRACKRIVMNIENSMLPGIRKKQQESASKQGLNVGVLEEFINEKLSSMCEFSSIFSNKAVYKECQSLMEQHEEGVGAAVLAYARKKAAFNLVTQVCHQVSSACPASTNSTESEVVKVKDKYMSGEPAIQPRITFTSTKVQTLTHLVLQILTHLVEIISERPDATQKKGGLIKIVAADWME